MKQLKELYNNINKTDKLKLNQAFNMNGWVVILNYFDGRIEVGTHTDKQSINSTSWKGFKLSNIRYEDIEEYVHKCTKGELKNNSQKIHRSQYLLLS